MRITNSDIKQFLKEGYAFRRNLLSGKIEYRELNEGGDSCTSADHHYLFARDA